MTRIWIALAVLALVVAAVGGVLISSRDSGEGPAGDALENENKTTTRNVVATTGMIGDMVRNVGGSHVRVATLMGPGVDPHLYKASEGDVTRMSTADLIVFNGLHLEGKISDVLTHLRKQGIATVAVTDGIDPSRLLTTADYEGSHDPHLWFDVALWSETVKQVRDALVTLDPARADAYRKNAETYVAGLRDLHAWAVKRTASIPESRRVMVTAHDAFGYFGRAYGMEVRGIQGVSTAAEAGSSDIQELAAYLAERRIPAIFVESSVPPRIVEALKAAVRSRGHQITIGGELFSDAMGDDGTPEGTYVGMVRHNVETIVGALSK